MAVYVWWVCSGGFLVRVFPDAWYDGVRGDTVVGTVLVLGKCIWCHERAQALVYFDQVGVTALRLVLGESATLSVSLSCKTSLYFKKSSVL